MSWGRGAIGGVLAAQAAAVGVLGATLLLAFGLPLAARGLLRPGIFLVMVVSVACGSAFATTVLLLRAVARPVERMLAAAERATPPGDAPGLPVVGEGRGIHGAALAFERVVAALAEERSSLAQKVDQLTASNAALAEARESLLRAERLATLGRVAAGLSHEVGNPLGAITGYAELARGRLPPDADPELRGALDRIAAAAARIDRTLRDLLDFARPAPRVPTAVALRPVAEAVLDLARVQPRVRSLEVETSIPDDLPAVRGDANLLVQVLLNLVLNGGDAMGGRGRLRIAAHLRPGDPPAVAVTVVDQGPGVPPDQLDHIFEPFFTTKARGEGSGLGLAVSRQIVESFGGTIRAANRPEGGAEFTVLLPCFPVARGASE